MEQFPPTRPTRIRDGPKEEEEQDEFKELAKTVYTITAEAQALDGNGNVDAAFKTYERGLQQIDKALSLPPSQQDDNLAWKLRNTRKEILERVSDLQHQDGAGSSRNLPPVEERSRDLPPAYDEVANERMTNYGDLAAALDEIAQEEGTSPDPLPINAREVFTIPSEVQIYFISADDRVSAPSYPSFLRVVRMDVEPQLTGATSVVSASVPAFLQVGDWTYPLIPGHSPLFRSTEGIYIFPDLSTPGPGNYVGLILPESIGSELRRAFEESLLGLAGVQEFPPVVEPTIQEKPPRPPAPVVKGPEEEVPFPTLEERRFSTKIAEGLISGAEAVSRGLIAGASKTTVLIDKGAAYLQSRMEPAKDKTAVKPEVRKGMKTAKTVTGKAVQVSGFIVTQVGRATIALGRHMAPHVHRASTRFLAKTVASDEKDAEAKVDQVVEVTAGAVVGFGTVYFGLENAAKALASSLANNTVKIVEHRYGEEMGELAKDSAGTAGNAALTALNVKNLAPKAVAKRVVKDTGRMVVKSHKEKHNMKGPE